MKEMALYDADDCNVIMIMREGADDYDNYRDNTSAEDWDLFPKNHDGDQKLILFWQQR